MKSKSTINSSWWIASFDDTKSPTRRKIRIRATSEEDAEMIAVTRRKKNEVFIGCEPERPRSTHEYTGPTRFLDAVKEAAYNNQAFVRAKLRKS